MYLSYFTPFLYGYYNAFVRVKHSISGAQL